MAAGKGSSFLLKIDSVGAGAGPYVTVGGFLANDFTINNEVVDITTKGSSKWRELIEAAGVQSMTLTGNGIFKDGVQELLMQAQAVANTILFYEIISENGDSFTAPFQLSSYQRGGEHNLAETFSVTFESAGDVVFAAA